MKYTIQTPEVLGEMVFLNMVADAMARRIAGAGNLGFHKRAYDVQYLRLCSRLIDDARAGRLVVCNRHGEPGTLDEIMAENQRTHEMVSTLHDANQTIVINVCTFIRQLNTWGDERGDTFEVAHEGVPWIDDRGLVNGELTASEPLTGILQSAPPSPPSLSTSDVAHVFNGLHGWNEAEWKKALGNKRDWLEKCIHTQGQRGVMEKRWNPVYIGAALIAKGFAKPNSVRAKFQMQPLLAPWLESWKDYEAEYLSND